MISSAGLRDVDSLGYPVVAGDNLRHVPRAQALAVRAAGTSSCPLLTQGRRRRAFSEVELRALGPYRGSSLPILQLF